MARNGKNLSIIALIVSITAVAISFLSPYYSILKPFDLQIRIDPKIAIHRYIGKNLGLYLDIYMSNVSPKNGLMTNACVILAHSQSPQDKYLLEFVGFRVLDSTKAVYIDTEERLPFLFGPHKSETKLFSFAYIKDEEFPITMGKYSGELLIWIGDNERASYYRFFQFQITNDILKEYNFRKDNKSTRLQQVQQIGYTPLESKKLSLAEYKLLK